MSSERVRAEFGAALDGVAPGLATANRLCTACVDLLNVDGAAISVIHAGTTHGTFGSSSELSRRLDELQFTFGEGPCLDAVRLSRPIRVSDLADPDERRWPAYAGAVLGEGVHAVYAIPVAIRSDFVGVLDLFRASPAPLDGVDYIGGLLAAELAALPLLDLMNAAQDWTRDDDGSGVWSQLDSLQRVEVYQATGMIVARFGVGPAEALVRLRAYAFARGRTASEVAWAIVGRRLVLDDEEDL